MTRDLPKTPGTYRFLDREGQILYVGKADHLRERVRSHFVANADNTRKVRQAIRMVEQIDWDEAHSPLEAVVREQQLILEHRPSCNLYGTRPETYAYLKVSTGDAGLSLSASCRAPGWFFDAHRQPPARPPLLIGPFRGRARLNAALDLLQRCYPIRECPRHPEARPCVRSSHGRCLAPCQGDPIVTLEHDALVRQIVGWLAGEADTGLPDPFERAAEVTRALSRQRRFEEAQRLQDAREHLLNIRRSYETLADAVNLRFIALWPDAGNGSGPGVRLNLVWNGELRESVLLHAQTLEEQIGITFADLWGQRDGQLGNGAPPLVAVPQRELDSLLAVRRWFYESERTPKIMLPDWTEDPARRRELEVQVATEAHRILSNEPALS